MTMPELRFKSNELLREVSLSEVGNFYGGLSGKTKSDFGFGDSKFITYMNVFTNTIAKQDMCDLVMVGANEKQNLVVDGDILFTQSSETPEEVGMASVWTYKQKVYLNSFSFGLRVKNKQNVDPVYLTYLLRSPAYRKRISIQAQGISRYNLSSSRLSTLKVKIPTLEEQQKIAAFLTALDEKILLIDKTIASLNDLKRGLMDRLFKRRVRFNGKDGTTFGKWRLSTIGAEGTFYYGKSAPKWSLSDTATTPCIRYGDLYTKHEYVVKDVDTYTEIEREKLVFSKGGEVLVPRVGEDPLDFCKCAYLPMKNIAIGEMISVYETDNDGLYISYYFNSQMKKTFAKYVEGGNVSNLYYTYLEGIELEVPTIDEQKRISDFLSVLIEKIDVNKNKKEKYVTLKRAFMQQMFV